MKIVTFLCIGFLFVASIVRGQSPGGIGTTNLMLWLKGDVGVTTGSTLTWADQSGHGRNGVQTTAANEPAVISATADYMNYHSGFKFTPDEWFNLGNNINTAGNTANEIYLVYKTLTSTPIDGFVLGTNTAGNRMYYYGSGVVTFGGAGKPSSPPTGFVTGGPDIFVGKYFSSSDAAMAANGGSFTALNPINPPATFNSPIFIGAQSNGSGGYNGAAYTGNVLEVVSYNAEVDLTGTQRQQVESYLALKYGITLDSIGTGGNYYNSSGTSVYQGGGGAGYFTNIIGIARDDNSSLYQKQSHLSNDSVRLYLGAVPLSFGTNAANTATFGSDKSYVVMGDNSGKFCSASSTASFKPASVAERLDREWKIVYNRTADVFNMDISLASCAAFSSGTGNVNDLELLYSTSSSNLTTGGVMANNSNGMTISLAAGGVVTIAGLSSALAAIAPATAGGTTVYFTLASNQSNVLPLGIADFSAAAVGHSALLTWTAYNSGGGGSMQIQRSGDGVDWKPIGQIDPSGQNSDLGYQFIDSLPVQGNDFYRLLVRDGNGQVTYSDIALVEFGGSPVSGPIVIGPNPCGNDLFIQAPGVAFNAGDIRLFTVTGQLLDVPVTAGIGSARLALSGIVTGIYFLHIRAGGGWRLFKVLKR